MRLRAMNRGAGAGALAAGRYTVAGFEKRIQESDRADTVNRENGNAAR